MTPLHGAAHFGHVRLVSLFLEKGSEVDLKDQVGFL
jgi:ankyrin repeat protein